VIVSRSSSLAIVALASALLAACESADSPPPAATPVAAAAEESPAVAFVKDPAAVKRGRSLFIGTCGAYCHSLHDGARGDVPDLFDCAWKDGGSDEEIFRSIADGVAGTRMVGFKKAMPEGETDVWKLVAFLRSESDCKKAP